MFARALGDFLSKVDASIRHSLCFKNFNSRLVEKFKELASNAEGKYFEG